MNKKRVPAAIPDAPSVNRDANWAPVAIPPAASVGGPLGISVRTALRSMDRGGAVALPCPPASCPACQSE